MNHRVTTTTTKATTKATTTKAATTTAATTRSPSTEHGVFVPFPKKVNKIIVMSFGTCASIQSTLHLTNVIIKMLLLIHYLVKNIWPSLSNNQFCNLIRRIQFKARFKYKAIWCDHY